MKYEATMKNLTDIRTRSSTTAGLCEPSPNHDSQKYVETSSAVIRKSATKTPK